MSLQYFPLPTKPALKSHKHIVICLCVYNSKYKYNSYYITSFLDTHYTLIVLPCKKCKNRFTT